MGFALGKAVANWAEHNLTEGRPPFRVRLFYSKLKRSWRSDLSRLLSRAEFALSLQPIIQLKARGSTPVKINLVRSLTNLLVSHFALGSLSHGFLRDYLLHLRRCLLGHRPPPGLRGLQKIFVSTTCWRLSRTVASDVPGRFSNTIVRNKKGAGFVPAPGRWMLRTRATSLRRLRPALRAWRL
jgi:hypothetical protein